MRPRAFVRDPDLNSLDSKLYHDVSLVMSQIVILQFFRTILKKCPYMHALHNSESLLRPHCQFLDMGNSLKILEYTFYFKALS